MSALPLRWSRTQVEGVGEGDEIAPVRQLGLNVEILDDSRLEWEVVAPLAAPGEELAYEVSFNLRVPEPAWAPHDPWDHFRIRSRLLSPEVEPEADPARRPVDHIRASTLLAAARLKDRLTRIRRDVRRLGRRTRLDLELAEEIAGRLHASLEEAAATRDGLLRDFVGEGELGTEARLAGEHLSARVITGLALVQRELDGQPGRRRAMAGEGPDRVREAVRQALEAEDVAREALGLPSLEGQAGRERFVRRAGMLKKHFHQLLFLDAECFDPEQRLGNWIAVAVAVVASTWAFAWQIAWVNQAISANAGMASLVFTALVAGILYAVKDRIKEVGRRWVGERLRDRFGDEVVHLRLQERIDPEHTWCITSLERIQVRPMRAADPLNPDLGETAEVRELDIRARIRQEGCTAPRRWGIRGVKHVLRYDLSELLPRLDDIARPVPVLRPDGSVALIDTPKTYALPLEVRLVSGDTRIERNFTLMLGASGIIGLEPGRKASLAAVDGASAR